MVETVAPVATDGKIVCHIDNVRVHAIQSHIKQHHADTWTIEKYQAEFPDAPLLSEVAKKALADRAGQKAKEVIHNATVASAMSAAAAAPASVTTKFAAFHEVFGLGNAKAALSASGGPIQISVLEGHDAQGLNYMPDLDNGYVFNIDLAKKAIIGLELNMPTYFWGFHGTGKTTILQQCNARTGRPVVRVQHTLNMQESEVIGQWIVKGGETIFQLGPLPMAMLYGWTYLADEYDRGMPGVLALYQPILEGQSLLIKDAPPQYRKIIPHPNFRPLATPTAAVTRRVSIRARSCRTRPTTRVSRSPKKCLTWTARSSRASLFPRPLFRRAMRPRSSSSPMKSARCLRMARSA
jgi:cobaltochelatase CobS